MPVTTARPKTPIPPSTEHGVVTTAPTALGEPMTVTLPSFSADHAFQIRYWTPRPYALPAVGDEVLIAFDDQAEPWCVSWWPQAGETEPAPEEPAPVTSVEITAPSAESIVFSSKVTGDTKNRLAIQADGKIAIGDGTLAADVNLYRSAAKTLKTDSSLTVAGDKFTFTPANDGTEVFRITNKAGTAYFTVDSESGLLVAARRLNIGASSSSTLLQVNATGAGNIADFQASGVSVLKLIGAKVGFFNVTPVVRATALTAATAEVIDLTYGEQEKKTIENLRTRVNEIETKLKAYGLLT